MENQPQQEVVNTTQNHKPKIKIIKIFNKIDLTKAIKVAKETEQKEGLKRVLVTKVKGEEGIKLDEISNDRYNDNCILSFLNSCHPDIRQFIRLNSISTLSAGAGRLRIITRNGFSVNIKSVGYNTKDIRISDRKGNLITSCVSRYTETRKKV